MLILTILVFPDIPSITFFDRNIEPADSHTDPSKNATPNVTVLAPTGVPQELAESFAPTAKERINPNRNAAKIVYVPYSEIKIYINFSRFQGWNVFN